MRRDTFTALRRYEPAHLVVSRPAEIVACVPQPRDLEILRALWAYRFLTTHDIASLWWETPGARAAQQRLARLFAAGYLVRFRPRMTRGSFPWTFALTRAGFALLQEQGAVPVAARYAQPPLHNFEYVRHDLQLNAWVIAYRRRVGDTVRGWLGEQESEVRPPDLPRQPRIELAEGLTVEGLRAPRPQLIRPDAVLELALRSEQGFGAFYIELDRTRRPDKARVKLARYDAFISWWWRHSEAHAFQLDAPYAIFVCQDEAHMRAFLTAADAELGGHEWGTRFSPEEFVYPARERVLFVDEQDMHAGRLEAWRAPTFPPGHPARHGADAAPHRVQLPASAPILLDAGSPR
jgi:hypothetical protein